MVGTKSLQLLTILKVSQGEATMKQYPFLLVMIQGINTGVRFNYSQTDTDLVTWKIISAFSTDRATMIWTKFSWGLTLLPLTTQQPVGSHGTWIMEPEALWVHVAYRADGRTTAE